MKIIHIITGIDDGGAEKTLYKICKYDSFNEHIVLSLKGTGKYYSFLNKIGIKVYCLNFKFYSIIKFFNLIKLISFLKPDIIQTWLVHGDFVGGIAARIAGFKNIVWNIRYSNLDGEKVKLTSILLTKILAKLSFILPKLIVVVSKNAKKDCKNSGYYSKKLYYIPNGYNLKSFKSSKSQKLYFRNKLKKKKIIPLIGFVARYDPMKDHINFLDAISILKKKNHLFFCILAGYNINKDNSKLLYEIKKRKLTNSIKLLGQLNNVSELMNVIDLHVLSSKYGEGFPNVVAEAMLSGTPCVATDVGDAKFIIGKTGWIVPKKNPKKLARAIERALNEMRSKKWNIRCNDAKKRIKHNFSINKMVSSYNKIWINTLKQN
jgi:glycosyltransferase involved in cell wall biosynthesis